MSKKQTMKTGEKLLFLIAGIFLLLAVVSFGALEYYRQHASEPIFQSKTHYQLSAEGQRGSELFRINRCTSCHRAMRNGTNMGPGSDLDGEGSKRSFSWIYAFLMDPERTYGAPTIDHGLPPKEASYVMNLPKEDLHAIATFLSELKAEAGSALAPVPPKGESPFIDTMVKTIAPEEWKKKYKDIREKGADAP